MSENNASGWERAVLEKVALAAVGEQRRARRWGIFFKFLVFAYLFAVLLIAMGWMGKRDGYPAKHTALVDVSGVIGPGTVSSPIAWDDDANPRDFTVRFHVDSTVTPPVTTYDIVDNVSGDSLLTGTAAAASGPYLRTYTEDGTIALRRQVPPDTNATDFDYGAEFTIKGSPATDDQFTVQASRNEDVFTTLYNLIETLETASSGAAANARLANGLNTALSNFDRDIDNLLRVQAGIGVRLRETDDAYASQEDLVGQYDETLSDLRDLDYAKAISDLARHQLTYEAAQKTFAQVQGLSLFQYI
jgi:flagellar hook-associated protein 3 FlgL